MLFITAFLFAVVVVVIRAMRAYERQSCALLTMFSKGRRVRDGQGREYVVTVFDSLGFVFLRPTLSGPTLSGPTLSGPTLSGPTLSGPTLRLVDLMTPAGTYRTDLLHNWTPA